MGRLTQRQITTLKPRGGKPTRYTDGLGLAVWVKPGDGGSISRSWIQRLRIVGEGRGKDQRVVRGLGSCQHITLKQARQQAYSNWLAAGRGENPFQRTAAHRVPTFEATAKRWWTAKNDASEWSPASAKLWWSALAKHVLPRIGSKPVNRVSRDDILDAVQPLWPGAQGRRVRGCIKSVLGAALARNHVEKNLAENGEIDGELVGKRQIENHKSLPFEEVPAAYQRIVNAGAPDAATAACRLLVLTALRSAEVRGLQWSEVDIDAKVIRLSADRMKADRPHVVPLSDEAVTVIEAMRGESNTYVFPSPRARGPLAAESLQRVLAAADVDAVPHGFRSSFRGWAGKQADYPREAAEIALSHVIHTKTEAAYARDADDLLEQRVQLMAAWAAYCLAA